MPVDTFPGEIRLANAVAALAKARAACQSGTTSIDLAQLTAFDSSALAVLAALRRDAPGPLSFRNPPANLRKLAALYGVDALLFDAADGSLA